MNPEVVNYIIAQRHENASPSSWQACEEHNKKHYGQTFLNMTFAPVTYKAWYDLLEKIKSNEFLAEYHLRLVQEIYSKEVVGETFPDLRSYVLGMYRGELKRLGAVIALGLVVRGVMGPGMWVVGPFGGFRLAISECKRVECAVSKTKIGWDLYRNQM